MQDEPDRRTARGRPRSSERQEAILQTTRDLLNEIGYTLLTTEKIAARSGTSKATIYRWWSNKGELALEATHKHINIGLVPDTGDTRRDLLAAAKQLIKTFTDRLAGIVIFAAISTVDHDRKMLEIFGRKYVYPWRQSAAAAVQRGIDRGDFPADTDVAYIVDLFAGMVFQRALVLPKPDTKGLAQKLVDTVLPPA